MYCKFKVMQVIFYILLRINERKKRTVGIMFRPFLL